MAALAGLDPADMDACRVVLEVLYRVGDKWTVLVVGALSGGYMRFNAEQRAIPGLSHRMLTLTLRALERDGLVERRAYPASPPKVEYELTGFGHLLRDALSGIANWAMSNKTTILSDRSRFDGKSPKRPLGRLPNAERRSRCRSSAAGLPVLGGRLGLEFLHAPLEFGYQGCPAIRRHLAPGAYLVRGPAAALAPTVARIILANVGAGAFDFHGRPPMTVGDGVEMCPSTRNPPIASKALPGNSS